MKKVLLFILLWSLQAMADDWVLSVGEGITPEKAMDNAMRNALEQRFGVRVIGESWLKNFLVTKDNVTVLTYGFISQIREISRNQLPDGLWQVKIECLVQENPGQEDVNIQRIFGYRRVLVLVRRIDEKPGQQSAAEEIAIQLKSMLLEKGFRVFDPEALKVHYDSLLSLCRVGRSEDLIQLICENPAEFLIFIDLNLHSNQSNSVKLRVHIESYVLSGRLFTCMSYAYPEAGEALIPVNNLSQIEMVLEKAGVEFGQKLAPILYNKLYQQIRMIGAADEYIITLRHYPSDKAIMIEETIRALNGLRWSRLAKEGPEFVEIECAYQGSAIKLALASELEKKGIKGSWISIGNWFILTNTD